MSIFHLYQTSNEHITGGEINQLQDEVKQYRTNDSQTNCLQGLQRWCEDLAVDFGNVIQTLAVDFKGGGDTYCGIFLL